MPAGPSPLVRAAREELLDPLALRASEFSGLGELTYLDHALRGPLPRRALEALRAAGDDLRGGGVCRAGEQARVSEARAAIARLTGGVEEGVGFVGNTTAAIACFAQSFPWAPGDVVLTSSDEVPSAVLPFLALAPRGVRTVVVPSRDGVLRLADVEAAASAARSPRVLSLAAVTLDTGHRRDLAGLRAIAEQHGALLCVDAAQALGALPVTLGDADVIFGCGRKWLLGPPEVGLLVMRLEVAERLVHVAAAGAGSFDEQGRWRAGAARFEGGALPALPIAGLAASVSLLLEVGIDQIAARVLELAALVAARAEQGGLVVRSPGGRERSGIVLLEVPGAPADLEQRLLTQGVVARFRRGLLRVSPHFWNAPGDVDRLFLALERCRG